MLSAIAPTKPPTFRSKNGCNTCKRRKVRCNERRPRCGHCERLNLECTWERLQPARQQNATPSRPDSRLRSDAAIESQASSSLSIIDGYDFTQAQAMGDTSFDNALWEETMLLSPSSWLQDALKEDGDLAAVTETPHELFMAPYGVKNGSAFPPQDSSLALAQPVASPVSPEDDLVEKFLRMFMPPILVPVEVGPKWATTRSFFALMARESALVRSAIKTFAAVQLHLSQPDTASVVGPGWQTLYDHAHHQLAAALGQVTAATDAGQPSLRHILVSMFLLIYSDLLTKSMAKAHANLRDAHCLIQRTKRSALSSHERRVISWIRLLDARAVSTAGGEGLFLGEDDSDLFETSPAAESLADGVQADTSIEEVLFDVLYHPGLLFFQKVQSFVGRITRIDPWHRTRGTVEDETEVMAAAEQIAKDLKALYDQRPALMDHCVAGDLTEHHLAKDLAMALTRSFRTYLANYYSSYIHLQRVAYVQYPKTQSVKTAIENIKALSHSMSETDEVLPVNLLWPLLMWGCEEEDPEERRWILSSIRSLESIATNAKVTAQLLEEVQRRQDREQRRVDVRKVSHECFAGYHFAIV